MSVKQPLIFIGLALIACLSLANGILLVFWPDLFLRFYDWQNPGDWWGKGGGWRKDVENPGLGVLLIAIGLAILSFITLLVF